MRNLLGERITARVNYQRIPDNDELGYSDEFVEQWNYDFEIVKNSGNICIF